MNFALHRLGLGLAFMALAGAGARVASAAAITGSMHEPFDYAAATQFGANSANNGGAGWNASGTASSNAANANWGATGIPAAHSGAAASKTATSPGLTSTATGYLAGTGNKFTLNDPTAPSGSQSIGRLIGGQSIDAGTFYFSFLSQKNNDTIRSMNLAFFNSGAAPQERFAIGQFNGALNSGGNVAMIFLGNNANLTQTAGTPVPYGINVTHLIVGKVEFNTSAANDTVTIWVDPTDVTTEAAAGSFYIQNGAFDLGPITTIRPFVGSAGDVPASSMDIDEIRIGGSWASVTSEAVAVPEPSAVLLLMAGTLAAALRRRAG